MILITGNDPPTTMMWSELLARAGLTPKPVAGWRAHGPLVRSAHVRRIVARARSSAGTT